MFQSLGISHSESTDLFELNSGVLGSCSCLCDALTQTGWRKILSKFCSSSQILAKCLTYSAPHPLPPLSSPCKQRDFWILADFDSASKVGRSPNPRLPTGHREFGILGDWDSASKVSRSPYSCPPPPLDIGNLEFFADLDSASKVGRTPYPPPPLPRSREFGILADFD